MAPKIGGKLLQVNQEAIRQTLHEDLGKGKIYVNFVPHSLTDELKLDDS
jgi:hypothetical protein